MTKLEKTTMWTVFAIACVTFALSYSALVRLALWAGIKPMWLAYLWPLALDAFLAACGLYAQRQAQQGESTKTATILVGIFALASIIFNVLEANGVPTGWEAYVRGAVFALPPVAFLIANELLASQYRSVSKRNAAQASLADTLHRLDIARGELADVRGEVALLEQRESALLAQHNERLAALLPVDIVALDAWRDNPHATQAEIAQAAGVKRQYIGQRKAHLELIGAIHENGNGVEVMV